MPLLKKSPPGRSAAPAKLASLTILPLESGTLSADDQNPELSSDQAGYALNWSGEGGRTYFVQYTTNLADWRYFPIIYPGDGSPLSHGFGSNAERFFTRLAWTDLNDGGDPPSADFDQDGLESWAELTAVNQTDPLNPDTDGDGLLDGWEQTHGLDPTSADTDGDGAPDGAEDPDGDGADNATEQDNNGDPNDAIDNGEGPLIITGDGAVDLETLETKTYTIPAGGSSYLLLAHLESMEFPGYTVDQDNEFNDQVRWKITPSNSDPIEDNLNVNSLHGEWQESKNAGTSYLGYSPIAVRSLGVVQSDPDSEVTVEVEIGITNIEDDNYPTTAIISLLPMEVAPEVLAVNSDFDEGRLDPATGYAIPDCYDVGDSLRAEIDHLDGRFVKDEVITEDLHQGWFGLNPSALPDDFFDGATVTIKKIQKPNTTYGGDQEGHIRLYATWEEADGERFEAINPYDLTTLSPINLVGVAYGAGATIPSDATFWIEGIWGGEITLEWRYQKEGVDVSFEQEFLVATQQTKQDWLDGIFYEIRLQSSDDIGGEVDITTFSTSGRPSFASNKEKLFEMYDYYPELFLQNYGVEPADRDEVMAWYGLARCTTAEIVGGLAVMEDAYIKAGLGLSVGSGVSFSSPIAGAFFSYLMLHSRISFREIQEALYLGAWDIFEDLAWQGRAYRASGIYALEHADSIGATFRFDGWLEIDTGRRSGVVADIRSGVVILADREQNVVVQPAFNIIQSIAVLPTWPISVNADQVFSLLAENPVPGGASFADFRGMNVLKNVAVATDRWDWALHKPDGIIAQWYSKTPLQHEQLDLEHIEVRGRGFHARHFWIGEEALLESEWKNDRPTRPHTTRYVP